MIRLLIVVVAVGLAGCGRNSVQPDVVPCAGCPYGHQCDLTTGKAVRPVVKRPAYTDAQIEALARKGCQRFHFVDACVENVASSLKKQVIYWEAMGIAVEISDSGHVLCEDGMNPHNECKRRPGFEENMKVNEFFDVHMKGEGGNSP
ncbi:MAG: hypothetical protein PHS14_07700 [Elusimicrobia bacterium]|nr:hypothetical protein [Elusimicrobiota bacterium]